MFIAPMMVDIIECGTFSITYLVPAPTASFRIAGSLFILFVVLSFQLHSNPVPMYVGFPPHTLLVLLYYNVRTTFPSPIHMLLPHTLGPCPTCRKPLAWSGFFTCVRLKVSWRLTASQEYCSKMLEKKTIDWISDKAKIQTFLWQTFLWLENAIDLRLDKAERKKFWWFWN